MRIATLSRTDLGERDVRLDPAYYVGRERVRSTVNAERSRTVRLADIIETVQDGARLPVVTTGVPIIRLSNIGPCELSLASMSYADGSAGRWVGVRAGDVLLTRAARALSGDGRSIGCSAKARCIVGDQHHPAPSRRYVPNIWLRFFAHRRSTAFCATWRIAVASQLFHVSGSPTSGNCRCRFRRAVCRTPLLVSTNRLSDSPPRHGLKSQAWGRPSTPRSTIASQISPLPAGLSKFGAHPSQSVGTSRSIEVGSSGSL